MEFGGEPLIREESLEVDMTEEGSLDFSGNQGQAEEEQERNPSTEQQTQESEVEDSPTYLFPLPSQIRKITHSATCVFCHFL